MTGAKAAETALEQLRRIEDFLSERFPSELVVQGSPDGSNTADVVIRLLTGLAAQGNAMARCTEQYCNLPASHAGPHGWVTVNPSSVAPG